MRRNWKSIHYSLNNSMTNDNSYNLLNTHHVPDTPALCTPETQYSNPEFLCPQISAPDKLPALCSINIREKIWYFFRLLKYITSISWRCFFLSDSVLLLVVFLFFIIYIYYWKHYRCPHFSPYWPPPPNSHPLPRPSHTIVCLCVMDMCK